MADLASPDFLSTLKAAYPPDTPNTFSHLWAVIAAVAFSASNVSEAVPLVFKYALEDLVQSQTQAGTRQDAAHDEQLVLARKVREAVLQSGLLSGMPRGLRRNAQCTALCILCGEEMIIGSGSINFLWRDSENHPAEPRDDRELRRIRSFAEWSKLGEQSLVLIIALVPMFSALGNSSNNVMKQKTNETSKPAQAINSLVALHQVMPEHLRETKLLRDTHKPPAEWDKRGEELFSSIYRDTAPSVQGFLDAAYPDLGWFCTTVGYGMTYGGTDVLSAVELIYVMVAALIAVDAPRQVGWHLHNARRAGASLAEARAVRRIALDVAARADVRWKGDVPDIEE